MSKTQPSNNSNSPIQWILIVFGSLAILSVFAIVALVTIAFPMVQFSREAAKRRSIAQNLRELEMALRNYEASMVPQRSSITRESQDLSTIDSVRQIVSEQLGLGAKEFTDNASFTKLGADELDVVELVMSLEEHFEVSIPDEVLPVDFGKLTVLKLAEIVERQRKVAGE